MTTCGSGWLDGTAIPPEVAGVQAVEAPETRRAGREAGPEAQRQRRDEHRDHAGREEHAQLPRGEQAEVRALAAQHERELADLSQREPGSSAIRTGTRRTSPANAAIAAFPSSTAATTPATMPGCSIPVRKSSSMPMDTKNRLEKRSRSASESDNA